MSKLADALRAAGIHNTWHLVGRGRPYLSFTPYQGRGGGGDWWQVVVPGRKTDPNAHWMQHGNKTFTVFRYSEAGKTRAENKAAALTAAKAWVEERFGISSDAWVPSPFGAGEYVPRDLLEARKAEIGYGRKRSA
jgi:hypothetical protein